MRPSRFYFRGLTGAVHEFHRAVMVAMAVVRVVQVAVDDVVHMVAVRDGRVPAVRAVDVSGVVRGAGVAVGAVGRIAGADR